MKTVIAFVVGGALIAEFLFWVAVGGFYHGIGHAILLLFGMFSGLIGAAAYYDLNTFK